MLLHHPLDTGLKQFETDSNCVIQAWKSSEIFPEKMSGLGIPLEGISYRIEVLLMKALTIF